MSCSRLRRVLAPLLFLACSPEAGPPFGTETSSLTVSVATVGHSQDFDGYQLRVNGETAGHVTVEDTLLLSQLDPGEYTLELADVAGNCHTTPGAPQTVSLAPAGNATASFVVGCDSVLQGVILFNRITVGPPGGFGTSEIFQVRPDGSGHARVTEGSDASASPDGRQIVFHRSSSIFRMNVDGTELVDLTPATFEDQCPVWSPDGSLIAFSSRRSGEFQMYTMRHDGSEQRRRTFSDRQEACGTSWSPDGSRFAFSRSTPDYLSSEIFVINADGTGEQKLSGEGDSSPAWSPDGRLIVFSSVRSGASQLWLMQADGQSPQILTGGVGYSYGAAVWSPNGEEIVFERGDANLPILLRMRTDGGGLVPLTAGGSWDMPSDWLP